MYWGWVKGFRGRGTRICPRAGSTELRLSVTGELTINGHFAILSPREKIFSQICILSQKDPYPYNYISIREKSYIWNFIGV